MSNKRKTANTAGTGEFLTQRKTYLTESAAKKGTYGYLRLLEFDRETRGEQAREIVVRWVESPDRVLRWVTSMLKSSPSPQGLAAFR